MPMTHFCDNPAESDRTLLISELGSAILMVAYDALRYGGRTLHGGHEVSVIGP
jgi:hypothetical protein